MPISAGSGHHNIVLNPDEKKVFGQLFQAADNESIGVVTGELAVKFFEKSGLSPRILGEVRCRPTCPHGLRRAPVPRPVAFARLNHD